MEYGAWLARACCLFPVLGQGTLWFPSIRPMQRSRFQKPMAPDLCFSNPDVSLDTGNLRGLRWNVNDFVFAPQNYAGRKKTLAQQIEVVRKLWRGETQTFSAVDGNETSVTILPRPVQAELPVWLSAFGSVETFQLASSIGAGILTHLVGQTVEDLANKIAAYREALRTHGHDPNAGVVAVMLHTFLGEDSEYVNIEPEAVFETENIVQLATAVEETLVQQIAEMSEEEAEAQLNKMPDQ